MKNATPTTKEIQVELTSPSSSPSACVKDESSQVLEFLCDVNGGDGSSDCWRGGVIKSAVNCSCLPLVCSQDRVEWQRCKESPDDGVTLGVDLSGWIVDEAHR